MRTAMRYAAFVSYSSADRRAGEQLQKALEAYAVPASLRGQDFGRGPVPGRIAPVFRDRWDADASADLGATLRTALHASAALIVLCSPAAARSQWVNEEIREFRRAAGGTAAFVLPVLLDGLPERFDDDAQRDGAFPPALFERWDEASRRWLADDREPLAPDLRIEGDGLRFAVMKLVAALTGVPLTLLTQRQAEAERRERNRARWLAGTMFVLALGAALGAWSSWRSGAIARERLENAVEMAARRVDDAAAFQDRYGVPGGVIHELLDGARKDFDELIAGAADTPTLALQRARLDRLLARLYESVGDGARHRELAARAHDALTRVPTERRLRSPVTWFARLPAAEQVEVERLLALGAQAQAQAAEGQTAGARALLRAMAARADALRGRADGAAARSLASQARAQSARLSYESGDLDAALESLREAERLLAAGSTADADPDELARVRSEQAEMLLELGRHAEALKGQEDAVRTLQQVQSPTPGTRRALAAALARRGDMWLAAQRDLDRARDDYLEARALLAELLAADGARADLRRDLSLTQERAGDAFLQAGDLDGARTAFGDCLALRRELVARNRDNVEWRRDLTVALERVADVAALQGRVRDADAAYDEALRLRQAARAAAPADPVAARDLAVLWMRIGHARANEKGGAAKADAAYGQAIGLLVPLVERADEASRWRRDLAVAHAERGEARRRAGRRGDAATDFRAALALITALRTAAVDDVQLQQDEQWLRGRLAR